MAAKTKTYKITYDDGMVRYRKLDEEGKARFEAAAKDKRSSVKSIGKGTPEPVNAE